MIDQPPIYFLLSDGAIFLNQLFPVFVAAEIEPRVNVRSLFARSSSLGGPLCYWFHPFTKEACPFFQIRVI